MTWTWKNDDLMGILQQREGEISSNSMVETCWHYHVDGSSQRWFRSFSTNITLHLQQTVLLEGIDCIPYHISSKPHPNCPPQKKTSLNNLPYNTPLVRTRFSWFSKYQRGIQFCSQTRAAQRALVQTNQFRLHAILGQVSTSGCCC